jgi:phosphopantetheine adenylyltransferase
VKGLRNGDDLDYEVNQLRFMEEMYPELKVVFIQCDKEYEHISSSALRNLERIQIGLSKKYIP